MHNSDFIEGQKMLLKHSKARLVKFFPIFWVSNLHFQFQLGPDIVESPEDNGASGGRTEQDNQDNNAGGTAELNLEV